MDVKNKVQMEGTIYGIVSVVIAFVIDKIILTESFVSWIAGDWEILYPTKVYPQVTTVNRNSPILEALYPNSRKYTT